MELCEGTLEDYVLGKLPRIPKDSLEDKIVLGEITLGLAHIHKRGMIHKDLRPPNIMLWRSPNADSRLILAKIGDFGLAEQLQPGKTEFSLSSQAGPPGILAPELFAKIDPRRKTKLRFSYKSDTYALGIVIAFTVLKGKHPYGEMDEIRLQSILMRSGCEPIGLAESDWDVTDLILKLTDKDPINRPDVPLVIYHPYFALKNKHTKADFEGKIDKFFSLFPSEENNAIRKIVFCRENINKWLAKVEKEQAKTKVSEDNALMKSLNVVCNGN